MRTFFSSEVPFKGMFSPLDRKALGPGMFGVANNVRGHRGQLACRGAIQAKSTTGITVGTLKGSAVMTLNGTEYEFVAVRSSGTTKVYYSTDSGVSPVTFTELTGTTGRFGNTRFSDDGNVCFALLKDQSDSTLSPFTNTSGMDILAFSNGTEVRVWTPAFGAFSATIAKHLKVWHPGVGKIKQTAYWPNYFLLTKANVTPTGGGAGTGTNNTAHPITGGTTLRARWGALVAKDDPVVFAFTTGSHIAAGEDVCIVYDTRSGATTDSFPEVWSTVRVKLGYGGGPTYVTLYDPLTDDAPVVKDLLKGFKIAAFRVKPDVVTDQNYTYLRFEYAQDPAVTAAPAGNCDLYVLAVGGGGNMAGGWSLGASYMCLESRAESIGVVADDQGGRQTILMGCQDGRNSVDCVPESGSEKVHYAYALEYQEPAQADLNAGVNTLLVYGAPPGSSAPLSIVASTSLASYVDPNWVAAHTVLSKNLLAVNVTSPQGVRTMPDGLNEPIPPCTSMATANGRLYCGDSKSQSSSQTFGSDVMYSEQDNPFRHRGIIAFNTDGSVSEKSGGRAVFHGEKVYQLATISGDTQSGDTVLAFTDRSLYAFSGAMASSLARHRRVSFHGTKSPWSVAVNRNVVFWVDQDKKAQAMDAAFQIAPIGRNRVDDVLAAVPSTRIASMSGCCYKELYYLAYTLSNGSDNRAVLVFDTEHDFWARDVPAYSVTFGRFFPFVDGSAGDQLRFWTEAGALLEHDATTGTQDGDTTNITVTLETGEAGEFGHGHVFMDPFVFCEADSGKTLTLGIVGRPSGATASSTTLLTATGSNTHVGRLPAAETMLEDDVAYVTVTGAMSAGKKIQAIGLFDFVQKEGKSSLERL